MVSKTIVRKLMKRIQHLISDQSCSLFSLLQRELNISAERANFLLSLGAIYHNGERIAENSLLQQGDWIRCHTEPRRFRSNIDWNKHVLFDNEDFIVVDKPPGLPCQASLDNKIENLLFLLSEKYKQNLLITHRLDVGTEGFIVLAKNKLFQRTFNQLLESRKVIKIYECLTTGPLLPLGRLTHWMLPHPRAPKILSATYGEREIQERWKHCELEILNSETVNINSFPYIDLTGAHLSETHLASALINYYRLQLHTGRTHQIRAQLSFESNPILGDQLYGGPKNIELAENLLTMNKSNDETSIMRDETEDSFLKTVDLQTEESQPALILERYALRCCELKFHFHGKLFEWQQHRFKSF